MKKAISMLLLCIIILLSSCRGANTNEHEDIIDDTGSDPVQSESEHVTISTEGLDIPGEHSLTIPAPDYHMVSRGFSDVHHAIDFAADKGTKVVAAFEGIVSETSANNHDGFYVTISHGGNIQTQYLHLDSYRVEVGDHVMAGDVIGSVGQTGDATGPHLCFKVICDGKETDPEYYLSI